jgi:hypothetical protein
MRLVLMDLTAGRYGTSVSRLRRTAAGLAQQVAWLCLAMLASVTLAAEPAADEPKPSKFRSPEDGWFDVSAFLDEKYGFVPVLIPITEPAVGYGGALGLTFIGKPREGSTGMSRPSITAVAGALTENDTWAVAGADLRQWKDDRLQTLFILADASVNLDFHGLGDDALLSERPLAYNLKPVGGLAQAKYRLGASKAWVGVNYMYAETDVGFQVPEDTPGLPTTDRSSRIGGLTPSLTWDSRDTIFTPGRGTYVELSGGFFGSALGGEDTFERATVVAMQFVPLHRRLNLGLRADAEMSFGDMPFYLRPFVSLRGAPVLRYQGENAARVETELRWQFWKRFSLVGFAGTGTAWNDDEDADDAQTVTTGGGGFRYELARKYKLHMGLDVAFGPDGTAFYVQFGSAWFRP